MRGKWILGAASLAVLTAIGVSGSAHAQASDQSAASAAQTSGSDQSDNASTTGRVAPGQTATPEQALSQSALGHIGHAIEPAVRPLGYDWKIGVSMVASFAAREVFVSTMGTIYGVQRSSDGPKSLAERIRADRDPATGAPVDTPLVAFGLLVFYVFALMCTSTLTMTMRETGGGWRGARWAALQFSYMLVLAYGGAFLIYRVGTALGFGGAA